MKIFVALVRGFLEVFHSSIRLQMIVQVTATFCIGGKHRDGLDGSFCTTTYEPQTNITLYLTVGDQNLPGLFGSGPWNDSSTQVLTNVRNPAHLSAQYNLHTIVLFTLPNSQENFDMRDKKKHR
jgi:hypothetical protein